MHVLYSSEGYCNGMGNILQIKPRLIKFDFGNGYVMAYTYNYETLLLIQTAIEVELGNHMTNPCADVQQICHAIPAIPTVYVQMYPLRTGVFFPLNQKDVIRLKIHSLCEISNLLEKC